MTKDTPKLETWQIFKVARKTLGPKMLVNIYGRRNARSAYDWSQDPAYTVQRVKRNPLECDHLMLSMLVERGREDVARAAIQYLETALEQDIHPDAIHDLKPTMDAEILADFKAVAALQEAIEENAPVEEIKALATEAKEEIARTLTKYLQEQGGQR